jgi:phosphopentomutase
MAGFISAQPFRYFPHGFPPEILEPWCKAIGVSGVLGNKAASGTEIIAELGEQHARSGLPIVYTSADSVFQVAAHEQVVGLETLYAWCQKARELLDAFQVARVIARPYIGKPGAYQRTYNRHDYSRLPGPTVLDRLAAAGLPVTGVGKIPDIYAGRGITRSVHTFGNEDGMAHTLTLMREQERGLVFTNLVDFDMLYGHRRDPQGYDRALTAFDRQLPPVNHRLIHGLCRAAGGQLHLREHGNAQFDPVSVCAHDAPRSGGRRDADNWAHGTA